MHAIVQLLTRGKDTQTQEDEQFVEGATEKY
jgi:hypothetical protein